MRNRLLVWYFRRSGEEAAARKRVCELEQMGCVPTFINISKEYASVAPPEIMFREHDALLVLGASELFFDGGGKADEDARKLTLEVVRALRSHVEYVLERDIPTFAFCFGHQLFAYVAGSAVVADPTCAKTGTHRVTLTPEGRADEMLHGVPDQFAVQYAHRDVCASVPESAALLAYGEKCHAAMLRYGKHVYTSQFHPELDRTLFQELIAKIKHYIDPGTPFHIEETPYGTELLRNFGKKILVH